MFEDNPYMAKLKEQFGMNTDVSTKIDKMLGKDQVQEEQKTE